MTERRTRRPNGSPENPVRSVRCADDVWEPARRRADAEGVTMSHVLHTFICGYGEGLLNLPTITTTFGDFRTGTDTDA